MALKSYPGTIAKLNLHRRRKHTLSGWLVQARQFYTTALADEAILTQLVEIASARAALEEQPQLLEN